MRFQVDGVCRMDSASSWPQREDSDSSTLFGRWLQDAWMAVGKQDRQGEWSQYKWIIQWFMLWATEVPSYWEPWETNVKHTSELSLLRVKELWYLPTRSQLLVLEGSSPWGYYVLSTSANLSVVEVLQTSRMRKPLTLVAIGSCQLACLGTHGHWYQHQWLLWGFNF